MESNAISETLQTMTRAFNFDEGSKADKEKVRQLAVDKKTKLQSSLAKKIEAEKRWLRKMRLCTTKLRKIRASVRRTQKQLDALKD